MRRSRSTRAFPPGDRILVLFTFIVAVAWSAGCLSGEKLDPGIAGEKIAAVTLLPQEDIVREIAGRDWNVIVVVPPGAEPHTYEPTASRVAQVSQADMYFRLGPGLLPFEDTLVHRITAHNPDIVVVDMSEGISRLYGSGKENERPDSHDSGADPHVWLSAPNLRVMAENVARALSAHDPLHAGEYVSRKEAYLAKVNSCEAAIRANLSGLEGRPFLVFHPAFGYFARDSGLVQVAVREEGHETGPAGLSRIIALAREQGISVVFAEPQFSTRESEVIAQEINGTVVLIDPLAPDVLGNLVRISGAIAESYGEQ